ncbi:hypothetical protein [Eisenbergiella tayi]|uniref:hypothetical protein n=1 Tax=Eisenbergiella tayi TaxID=1432052 RepID=UPI00143145FE|nr:hypothetical protein [Eisenbergiella tayi]
MDTALCSRCHEGVGFPKGSGLSGRLSFFTAGSHRPEDRGKMAGVSAGKGQTENRRRFK